jgi:hypothetical protein
LTSVAQLLRAKHLHWLLNAGELWFASGTDDNQHARYIPQHDLIVLDVTWYPSDGLCKSLIHELGHRLYFRLSTRTGFKVWWQHIRQNKASWHHNPEWLYSHHETFAEMFRYYVLGQLPDDMEQWLTKLIADVR